MVVKVTDFCTTISSGLLRATGDDLINASMVFEDRRCFADFFHESKSFCRFKARL